MNKILQIIGGLITGAILFLISDKLFPQLLSHIRQPSLIIPETITTKSFLLFYLSRYWYSFILSLAALVFYRKERKYFIISLLLGALLIFFYFGRDTLYILREVVNLK